MDLWIRSQDKEHLLKVNDIQVKTNVDKYCVITKFIEFENGTQMWVNLGIYKSEERALEVIDEIQNILFPKDIYKIVTDPVDPKLIKAFLNNQPLLTTNGASVVQSLNNYVYEMPKE